MGWVMLRVMDFHRACVDVGFERIVGVAEFGECVSHKIEEFGLRIHGPFDTTNPPGDTL